MLFCSCVCFGNIGRRLALRGRGRKKASVSMAQGNGNEKSIDDLGNGHTRRR